jgi:hypothetical protein
LNGNHWRYRSIKQALRQLMPKAGKELEILAALVSGIVGSKSTHYSHIASKVAGQIKLESRIKIYSRWVKDVGEKQVVNMIPFAAELLSSLAALQTLAFVMDGSEVGRACLVLTINVIFRSRALPIARIVVKGCKGHSPEDTHVKLVQKVHEMVPEDAEVVFLGDGEFDGTVLQAELEKYHWQPGIVHWLMCAQGNQVIHGFHAWAEKSLEQVEHQRHWHGSCAVGNDDQDALAVQLKRFQGLGNDFPGLGLGQVMIGKSFSNEHYYSHSTVSGKAAIDRHSNAGNQG